MSDAEAAAASPEASTATGNATAEEEATEPAPEWLDALGNGKLLKKTLRAGQGRATRPQRDDVVEVVVTVRLDGRTLRDHQRLRFRLGDGDACTAWELAIQLMEVGEVCAVKSHVRYDRWVGMDARGAIPGLMNLTPCLPHNRHPPQTSRRHRGEQD